MTDDGLREARIDVERLALVLARSIAFPDDGTLAREEAERIAREYVAFAAPDRAASSEGGDIDVGRLARLIVSYADLTHETVVNGGDWRDIAKEWSAVVDECRAYLARASAPESE